MKAEVADVMRACAAKSLADEITFPEVVSLLASVGVERYHADYCRHEVTYYLPDGDSCIVSTPHAAQTIATDFSPSAVEDAVRQSQRGEHSYVDFVRKTMKAGCVGYFVQIVVQCAIYFGRDGSSHVEQFPKAADH